MENLFKPRMNIIVGFCAVFIIVVFALRLVSDHNLKQEAEQAASPIFVWQWPGEGIKSTVVMTGADVLKRSDNDAVVRVHGTQTIVHAASRGSAAKSEESPCQATITFYKESKKWYIGCVELE